MTTTLRKVASIKVLHLQSVTLMEMSPHPTTEQQTVNDSAFCVQRARMYRCLPLHSKKLCQVNFFSFQVGRITQQGLRCGLDKAGPTCVCNPRSSAPTRPPETSQPPKCFIFKESLPWKCHPHCKTADKACELFAVKGVRMCLKPAFQVQHQQRLNRHYPRAKVAFSPKCHSSIYYQILTHCRTADTEQTV